MIGIRDDPAPFPAAPPDPTEEWTIRVFAEGGHLEDRLGLEHRAGQERMARAVAAALTRGQSLLFEAGTGIGKSLAYLLPGIIHATARQRQMIVSTHTIALQEQIQGKDLPLCRRLFATDPEFARCGAFESTVLVGKSNYLCTTRLSHALADRTTLFADAEFGELQRIAAWAEQSPTGLRHELTPPPPPEVWEAVNADSSTCSRRHCDPARCPYQRARARLRSARVIIVNHALLFALMGSGGGSRDGEASPASSGILFPDDFAVLDEAHTVPEVAEDNLGLSLSSFGVERTLRHLYNPATRRGLLARRGDAEACQLAADALAAGRQFFSFLASTVLAQQPVVRLREPGSAEPLMDAPLGALHRRLARMADRLEEGRERDELLDEVGRLKAIQAGVGRWLDMSDEGSVHWAERVQRRAPAPIVTLRSAPVDVAPDLRARLFSGPSVICTSATLALAGSMESFAARAGAEDVPAGVAESPFDFDRCMRVFIAADIPAPSLENAQPHQEAIADYVSFCCGKVAGGSLVLFTSYKDMRAVAAAVEPVLTGLGRPFLIQGAELSRTELVGRMRALGNAVLFGTESFWTGVDVPGDALSQVVVTRLPFSPPSHPIAEARAERVRGRGGDPFAELTLPEAVVRFRQGIGRLIRTAADRGVVTVLDSRVLNRPYGRLFAESLPRPGFERLTRANRGELFNPFPLRLPRTPGRDA